ncbi:MAG TPA: hypothetical protein VGG39_37955 [Polyangiaceae bacterium]|jgi:hypothetical protein
MSGAWRSNCVPWMAASLVIVGCTRPSTKTQIAPRALDVCAGDGPTSKLEDWPGGTELADPLVVTPGASAPGRVRWSQPLARTDAMRIDDVAVLGHGLVAVGTVTGPVTVDEVKLVPRASTTPFLLRLDEQGHVAGGAVLDGLPHGDAWLLVATGPADNVVIAGPATIAPGWEGDHAPEGTPFLASIGLDGTVNWQRPLPVQRVAALVVGRDGSIAFTGTFKEPVGTITSIVARWSHDGTAVWQKTLGDPVSADHHWPAVVRSLALDGEGAVIVAGTVYSLWPGHLDLGQGAVNPRGEGGFIARFRADGNVLWSRGIAYGEPYALATAGDTIAIGGEVRCGSEAEHAFVLAMDNQTGAARWARRFPQPRRLIGRVAVAADGGVAFTEWGHEVEEKVVVGSVSRVGEPSWTRQIFAPVNGPRLPPRLVEAPAGPVLLTARNSPLRDVGRLVAFVK